MHQFVHANSNKKTASGPWINRLPVVWAGDYQESEAAAERCQPGYLPNK